MASSSSRIPLAESFKSESDAAPELHSEAPLIDRLKSQIDAVLSPLLSDVASCVLFDFPDHNNVGDSAIFLGELAYLRQRHNLNPSYICRADQIDVAHVSTRYKDAVILAHGGGNFGDLWTWHHDRREALLESFPGRRIIQLAQTIQFNSRAALKRTSEIIKRHGNFVLCVRDLRSYELAVKEFGCTVVACPDMAIWLGQLQRPRPATHELLLLLRKDHERAPGLEASVDTGNRTSIVRDWEMDDKPTRAARKLLALGDALVRPESPLTSGDELRNQYFKTLAKARFDRGLRLLSSGQYIITDRLHAYLLALLLDIPRSVIDNSYGKLSGFIDMWMREDSADTHSTLASVSDAVAVWKKAYCDA
jgi:exopolysaccharide biosynthesis predicted pyruvyltransferase EpsI